MSADGDNAPKYNSFRDILDWHGLFVLAGYVVMRLLRWTTPTRLWAKLSCVKPFKTFAWDSAHEKSCPWWQDLGVILHITLVYLIVRLAFGTDPSLGSAVEISAWYLLVDIVGYHAGILWFDDLTGEADLKRKVWSHRRIFFQAVVNLGESICLFAVLYHGYQGTDFWTLLTGSFEIATTLSRIDGSLSNVPIWVMSAQVVVSLFFLVVAISVVASIGYARPELGKTFDDK